MTEVRVLCIPLKINDGGGCGARAMANKEGPQRDNTEEGNRRHVFVICAGFILGSKFGKY